MAEYFCLIFKNYPLQRNFCTVYYVYFNFWKSNWIQLKKQSPKLHRLCKDSWFASLIWFIVSLRDWYAALSHIFPRVVCDVSVSALKTVLTLFDKKILSVCWGKPKSEPVHSFWYSTTQIKDILLHVMLFLLNL